MIKKRKITAISLFLVLGFVFYFLINNLNSVLAEGPVEDIVSGPCNLTFKAYSLIPGAHEIPITASGKKNYKYGGTSLWEFFHKTCQGWGGREISMRDKQNRLKTIVEDRGFFGRDFFRFNKDGSFKMDGNLAIGGTRTYLLNDYGASNNPSVGIGYSTNVDGEEYEKNSEKKFLTFSRNSGDLKLTKSSTLGGTWNTNLEYGPSVYFNKKDSKLSFGKLQKVDVDAVIKSGLNFSAGGAALNHHDEFFNELEYDDEQHVNSGGFYISKSQGNKILKKCTNKEECGKFPGVKYPSKFLEGCQFDNAKDFSYKNGQYYIADHGNNRILKCNANNEQEYSSIGRKDWNWDIRGLAVDSDGLVYVTDAAEDQVIAMRLKLAPGNEHELKAPYWHGSVGEYENYFYNKLMLTGEEALNIDYIDGSVAQGVNFKESSIARYDVRVGNKESFLQYDPVKEKITMKDEDSIFGKYSYNFDKGEGFVIDDARGLEFYDHDFLIDFWVNFNSVSDYQIFVSQSGTYTFGYNGSSNNLFFTANFDLGENKEQQETFNVPYSFQANKWYHVALNKTPKDEFVFFINGKKMSTQHSANDKIKARKKPLYIGKSADGGGLLKAKIDNFKITRGTGRYFKGPQYYFDNPEDIVIVGGYLFIADSGNNRIVKMNKNNFKEWSIIGELGDGEYQFNNPTGIDSDAGFFYVADKGNNRVIKTRLGTMLSLVNSVGSSWEEIDWSRIKNSPVYYDMQEFKNQMVYETFFNPDIDATTHTPFKDWEVYDKGIETKRPTWRLTTLNKFSPVPEDPETEDAENPYHFLRMDFLIGYTDPQDSTYKILCDGGAKDGEDHFFPVVKYNLTKELDQHLYSGKKIIVYAKFGEGENGTVEPGQMISGGQLVSGGDRPGSGVVGYGIDGVYAQLTKHPGNSRKNNFTNKGLTLNGGIEFLGGNSDEEKEEREADPAIIVKIEFEIPKNVHIESNDDRSLKDDLYLTFSSCNDVDLRYLRVEVEGEKIKPHAVAHNNGDIYIADNDNSLVIKLDNGDENILYDSKKSNLSHLSYPQDLDFDEMGNLLVLNGVSNTDMSFYAEGDYDFFNHYGAERMKIVGTSQVSNLNTKVYGNFNSLYLNASTMLDEQGVSVNYWNQLISGPSAPKNRDRVWVTQGIGQAISYCPEYVRKYGFKDGRDGKRLVNIDYDFLNGPKKPGMNTPARRAEDYRYKYGGWEFNPEPGCDIWLGLGPEVNCASDKTVARGSTCSGPFPFPVSGHWNWYETWPDCSFHLPKIDTVELCKEPRCCVDLDADIPEGEEADLEAKVVSSIQDEEGNIVEFKACTGQYAKTCPGSNCADFYKQCTTSCEKKTWDCFKGYSVRYRPDYKLALIEYGTGPSSPLKKKSSFYLELYHDQYPIPKDMEIFLKGWEDLNRYRPFADCSFATSTDARCKYTSFAPGEGRISPCNPDLPDPDDVCNIVNINEEYLIPYGENTVKYNGEKKHLFKDLLMKSGRKYPFTEGGYGSDFERWIEKEMVEKEMIYIYDIKLWECLNPSECPDPDNL